VNSKPNMSGIVRYWRTGEDDRIELARASGLSKATVDRALAGLWKVLLSKRRTKFVGFGVFEWRPWRRPLPTGKVVETWRLAFKPSRYAKRFGGRK